MGRSKKRKEGEGGLVPGFRTLGGGACICIARFPFIFPLHMCFVEAFESCSDMNCIVV